MAVIKNKTLDTFNYEEKFINFIMKHGKKSVAKRIYEDTLKEVPVEVRADKRFFFATKWILDAARGKSGKAMYKRLSEELLAAYSNQGAAVKKKEEAHKMAEANKAFAYMAKYIN